MSKSSKSNSNPRYLRRVGKLLAATGSQVAVTTSTSDLQERSRRQRPSSYGAGTQARRELRKGPQYLRLEQTEPRAKATPHNDDTRVMLEIHFIVRYVIQWPKCRTILLLLVMQRYRACYVCEAVHIFPFRLSSASSSSSSCSSILAPREGS